MSDAAPCFVGLDQHGCWVAVVVKGDPKFDSREVAKMVRSGLTVQTVTVDEVRKNLRGCSERPAFPDQPIR